MRAVLKSPANLEGNLAPRDFKLVLHRQRENEYRVNTRFDASQDDQNEGFAAVSSDAADLEPVSAPVSKNASRDVQVIFVCKTPIRFDST